MDRTMIELFAGVGGFRLGLEKNGWETVWANQYEPSTKAQHAYDIYVERFGKKGASNKDIKEVDIKKDIPDYTLLVGGFPCQDYSVARTKAEGIVGKKGVLWWSIHEILKNKKPPFALLENVDRLIKSPAKQRGRDFGVMLRTVSELGYALEWRVINAANYGLAQRRRRVFLFLSHKSTKYYKNLHMNQSKKIVEDIGFFSDQFPIDKKNNSHEKRQSKANLFESPLDDLVKVSDNFSHWFWNSGIMKNGKVFTKQLEPMYETPVPLKKILDKEIPEKYFIDNDSSKLARFKHMKGAKKEARVNVDGYKYFYSEGSMSFPDALDKPARTILTSESSVNRSTHVIKDPNTKRLRLLTPRECERINHFNDDWTKHANVSDKRRYFLMGNALVVGLIERMALTLNKIVDNE
jgi:DNA (cytosine-5)-methyltransferase 1